VQKYIVFVTFFLMTSLSFAQNNLEKIELERSFEQKMRHFYPESKFRVKLTFERPRAVEITLFSEVKVTPIPELIETVRLVEILTDADTTEEETREILGLNRAKVVINKFTPKEMPVVEKQQKQWDKIQDFAAKFQFTLAFLGILLVALCIFIATFIIRNSLLKLPGPLAAALGQSGRGEVGRERAQKQSVQVESSRPQDYQLLALLSDLYWTGSDEFAAALIRRYPEIQTFKALSFGGDYIDYLKMIEPADYDFWEDSYYLSPSKELLEMSIEDMKPEYFLNCSKIRLKYCSLSSYDLAKLRLANPRNSIKIQARMSLHRELVPPFIFKFNTVSEERDFINSDLPDSIKCQAPSLYVLTKIDDEAFTEIMKGYNVNELSRCWFGPDEVLNAILARLPEKKRSLLSEIVSTRSSTANFDRSSEVFQGLLRKARLKMSPVQNGTKNLSLVS